MEKSGAYSDANAPPPGEPYPQPPPSYNQSQNVYPSEPMTQPMYPSQPMPMHTMGMQQPPQSVPVNNGMYQPQQQPLVLQVNQIRVGPSPCPVTCPSCHAFVTTRVEYVTSGKTHLIALLLCLFGCGLCACIPYCVDACKNANHYCPECQTFIGLYDPTGARF